MKQSLKHAGRPAEVIVGLIFLAGALLKAKDINLFAVQIAAYGVLPGKALLGSAAVATLFMETALSIALLTGFRLRGWTFAALEGILVFFSGLILYGWLANDLEDCGCFGPLEMSPTVSLAKNVALLMLGALAWLGYRFRPREHHWGARSLLAGTVALGVAAGVSFYAGTELDSVVAVGGDAAPLADLVLTNEDNTVQLGEGEYIVALLDMDCDHCRGEVLALNDLAFIPDLPPVVCIAYEEAEGMQAQFVQEAQPDFPLYKLDEPLRFFSLVGRVPPRIAYVKDGWMVKYWDDSTPTYTELLDVMGENRDIP